MAWPSAYDSVWARHAECRVFTSRCAATPSMTAVHAEANTLATRTRRVRALRRERETQRSTAPEQAVTSSFVASNATSLRCQGRRWATNPARMRSTVPSGAASVATVVPRASWKRRRPRSRSPSPTSGRAGGLTDPALMDYHGSMAAKPLVFTRVIDRSAPVGPQVYEAIRDGILDLTLEPGQSLSEKEISLLVGVSRTPVREAFIRLAREGLVRVWAQTGTFVSKIDIAQVEEGRFVREALECAAIEDAARKVTDADLDELDRLLTAQRGAQGDSLLRDFFEFDEEFHRTLIAISGHPLIWEISREIRVHVGRLRRLSLPAASDLMRLVDQHAGIVEALRARDASRARKEMRRHLGEVSRVLPVLAEMHPDFFESAP
ncbi:GntR family transcriptional regulator [Baekduia alba]|uniref:GntR family transcriptional regulator n=1 Tax=Baekduia alba TaxID=2997333 RepID=UPI0032C4A096